MTVAASVIQGFSDYSGIYDVPEVARYIKASDGGDALCSVSSAKLLRWIRRGVASPDLVDVAGTELLIAFEDLVSMRVVTALRSVGVKWSEIYRTEEWLRDATGHERPFATEYLWTGQGDIFIDWTERLLSASRNGQLALELLKEHLIPVHGLVFGEESKVAVLWEPMTGIVLEPTVQFGSPCLKGTRIPARTVAGMVEAGDSVEWVAQSYGVSSDEVKVACDWEARVIGG